MVNVVREIVKNLNLEEPESVNTPPSFEVVCNDDLNDNTPRLSLGQVMNTRLGICFRFKDKMYTYEFIDPDYAVDIDEVKQRVKLLDIRRYDESIIKLESDQFSVVRIIETEEYVILDKVLVVIEVNVESWAVKGLEKVFSRLHTIYFDSSEFTRNDSHIIDLY